MARRRPYSPAVIFPHSRDREGNVSYTHYTFRQLDEKSDILARGLYGAGIRPGDRAALMVPPSLDFFSLTFALFKVGAVMIGIDPGIGIRNLGRCLAEAEPRAFIGVGKAHLARRLLRWGKATIDIRIFIGPGGSKGGSGNYSLPDLAGLGFQNPSIPLLERRGGDEAAILFTSGSTGAPKGAVYSHANFDAQVAALKEEYGIEHGEVDLCTFPLFALFAPALGMTAVIPEMDFTRPGSVNPDRIFEGIENFGVTNLFGSPALLRRVGEEGRRRGMRLPTLRRVICAGAPVPSTVLETFSSLLAEGVEVFTGYGATEALPVCSIGSGEILSETAARSERGEGICVGRPVVKGEVAIIAISDDPVPEWSDALLCDTGRIGEIVVRGPVVTSRYFNRDEATALAKIHGPGEVFRHRMGDLGYLDEKGRLWFCGRKTQRVRAPAGDMYTIPCESIFNCHGKVYRSALVGVERRSAVLPVICVELHPSVAPGEHTHIEQELLALGAGNPLTENIKHVLFHPSFPVDTRHNAKIGREKLALWAQKKIP